MAEEQMAPEPESEKPAKPKKKLIKWILIFGISYVLVGAGNYFYLKNTYVPPPPPPPPEEKKPVLTIDLNGDESEAEPSESQADTTAATVEMGVASADTVLPADSLQGPPLPVASLSVPPDTVAAVSSDEEVAPSPALAQAEARIDTTAMKRSAKLAKIVENMPAEDAAEMLQPLSDEMIINILLRLKQRQAAKIMAEIPASRAAAISRAILQPTVEHKSASVSSIEP